jgi:prepilin peptidase CpaA
MEIPGTVTALALAFFVACWTFDLRSRSIPNALTGFTFLTGLVLNFTLHSFAGLWIALLGAVLTGGLLVPPWALGGVGGGDVKMMGAFGALVGPRIGLYGLAAGLVLGGMVAVVHLVRIGRLREKLGSTRGMVVGAVNGRSTGPLRLSADAPDAVTLPYSLPLGAGAIGVLLLMRAPHL